MDPIHTSQSSQNDKPIKRSNLHRVFDFIIGAVLVSLVLLYASDIISQYMNPYGESLGLNAGFGIFIGAIVLVVFPVFAILSLFTLYLELRYIKVNLLSKKELFKAPSFYATLYIVFSIGTGAISYLAYM